MSRKSSAFVGIDAGTTGCTVMIFDEAGNALGHGYEEYPCTSPNPGWSEQDVEAVWKGICNASRQAVKMAALPADAYRSVGLSSQRGTFIFLDDAKMPLGNSIVWNCGRALKYQEIFSKEISPADHQDHTGMQLSPLW
jgi:xylulokinase